MENIFNNRLINIGPEFDWLGRKMLSQNDKDLSVKVNAGTFSVVSSIKNEGLGILEWVAYYKILGFDSIHLYTNNNEDGSDELLHQLAEHGYIYLINNFMEKDVSPQFKSFRHAISQNKSILSNEWVLFIDNDEYLCLSADGIEIDNVKEYIKTYDEYDQIYFCWKWFAGERAYEHDFNKLNIEKFKKASKNYHGKSLIRMSKLVDFLDMHKPKMLHDSKAYNFEVYSQAKLPNSENYKHGQLNHYWQKSFQEYFSKMQRGRGAVPTSEVQRKNTDFFDWWSEGDLDTFPSDKMISKVKIEIQAMLSIEEIKSAFNSVKSYYSAKFSQSEIFDVYSKISKQYKL
jgi:hypothetical protein